MSAKSDKIVAALKARAIAEAQQGDMTLFDSIKDDLGLNIGDTGVFQNRTLTISLPVRENVTLEQLQEAVFIDPDYFFEQVEETWWDKYGSEDSPEFELGNALFLSDQATVTWK